MPDQGQEIHHIPESPEEDTSLHQSIANTAQYYSQHDDLLTIPEEDDQELDPPDQDTLVFDSESNQSDNECFNTAVITTSDDSAITMGKPVMAAYL